jgi:hypothetical protein
MDQDDNESQQRSPTPVRRSRSASPADGILLEEDQSQHPSFVDDEAVESVHEGSEDRSPSPRLSRGRGVVYDVDDVENEYEVVDKHLEKPLDEFDYDDGWL